MSFRIIATPNFGKDAKALNKKYKTFLNDLLGLKKILLEDPRSGIALGNSCFKIRIAIKSKRKGKSGGARVITHVLSVNETDGIIYLLAVYDKSEQESITDKQITALLNQINY